MAIGLVLLQAATWVAVRVAARHSLAQTVEDELLVASRLFDQVLETRGQKLSDSARVLTADFGFREVVATHDARTIRSVLANHGRRIDAERAFLISLAGVVEVDTLGGRYTGQPFPIPELTDPDAPERGGFGVVSFAGTPYQFVVVPVMAPEPVALVGLGFPIDRDLLDEVSQLSGAELSLFRPRDVSGAVLISTLERESAGEVRRYFESLGDTSGTTFETLEIRSQRYGSLARQVPTADGSEVHLLLKRSLDAAWHPFRTLELQIFLLSSIALLGALAAAKFLAHGVSQPLERLAAAAQKIEHGDYSPGLQVFDKDELGQVSSAFDKMRVGIASREAKVIYQATHDGLTKLPNRTLFLDRLEQALRRAKRAGSTVGIIIMDLDGFKEINDTLGHERGDDLLREVAERLSHAFRDSDSVARLGGDEFAVILENCDVAGCIEATHRIKGSLEAFVTLESVSVAINGSIGIAVYPEHAQDAGTLMKRADVAMYDAKKNQTEVATYEPDRDEHSVRRLAILSALGQAIENDELELHYQPKVDIRTARAVHVEALVRWRHSELGVIFPDEFIPQAERSGKIRLLTDWVIAKAVDDCARWNNEGLDLTVAVNVSALDLRDHRLVDDIRSRLSTSGLEASKLVIEVTESAVMKDAGRAASVLEELHEQGVVIAIDDFGTGYSSLSQLRRLPVGELKIDRSFVSKLKESADDTVIVRSTIELGHGLGLKVVAEGVEEQADWNTLQTLGCDMAQGYFISRPLPAADLVEWMRTASWGRGREPSGRIA